MFAIISGKSDTRYLYHIKWFEIFINIVDIVAMVQTINTQSSVLLVVLKIASILHITSYVTE
jgi:hypothetical protein